MSPVRVPSPATIGLGVFAAGVAAGIGGLPVWVALPAVLAVAVGVRVGAGAIARVGGRSGAAGRQSADRTVGSRFRFWWWVLLAAAGVGHGVAARWLDRQGCGRLDPDTESLEVRLVAPAPPNVITSAEPVGGECGGSIGVRQPGPDTLWAGDRLRLEGRWTTRASRWRPTEGLFVVRTAERRSGRPSPVEALRNRLVRASNRLYGPRSGVVQALVLGTRAGIDPAIYQAFVRTGLVHLLSISGFHVGLIWAWALLLLRLAGLRSRAPPIAFTLVVAYVGFIGAPAPAIRAALLAGLVALETWRQRRPAIGALFAVIAWLVLVVDPWAVGDLGAWLSVAALWGATALTRWSDRAIGTGSVWRLLAASTGATLATAPLTAFALGTVAFAGIGLNLLAIPLTALAVPAVVASLVCFGWWPAAAQAMAAGGGALLGGLELVAGWGARLPGAALLVEPGLGPGLAAAAVLAVAVWVVGSRNTGREAARRLGWAATVASLAHLAWVDLDRPHTGTSLTLHFLDVGQGDAALVRTQAGHWILIDAGPRDDRGDAGARVVAPFLARHGVRRLEAIVLSHAHRDHFGGIPSVLERVRAGVVLEPAVPTPDAAYVELLDQIDAGGTPWRPLRAGARFTLDDVSFEVLHPDTTWSGWRTDLNEDSAVLRLTAGDFTALFAGDAGLPVEALLSGRVGPVDVLKVGHHGSRTATGAEWLAEIRPRAAIVSVGRNRYGHPAPETLGRLARVGVAVWRADREGTITVEVGPGTMRVTGRATRRTLSTN